MIRAHPDLGAPNWPPTHGCCGRRELSPSQAMIPTSKGKFGFPGRPLNTVGLGTLENPPENGGTKFYGTQRTTHTFGLAQWA